MVVGIGMITLIALIMISATVALVLAIAWHEFGRPVHARTWAIGFALLAVMWAIDLLARLRDPDGGGVGGSMLALAGIATMLNTLGFRQRAGIARRSSGLVAAAAANGVLVTLLAALGAPAMARAIPFCLLNAVMFSLAARALTGQRRKGERAAARGAQGALLLLSMLNGIFLVGMIADLFGLPLLNLAMIGALTMLLMPAIVTGIGLFAIILLGADLAEQARRLARTDMLTRLLNRRGFEDAGRALIAGARRLRRSVAIVLIDVDRFKEVNDRFGHPAGDQVLRTLCDTIGRGIRPRDVFARIGGEEFALIMADTSLAAAQAVAEALRAEVAAMTTGLAEPHRVTASFGVAVLEAADSGLADLVRRADAALYQAKEAGRDRVVAAG